MPSANFIKNNRICFSLLALAGFFLLLIGCGGGGSSSSGGGVPVIAYTTISGNVTSAVPVVAGNLQGAVVANADNGISGAEVWVEDQPALRAVTGADGSFLLERVPAGNRRLVANVQALDGRIYKVRSALIPVGELAQDIVVGELALTEAAKKVGGVLKDIDGNPVRNAVLSLWGESFNTDSAGAYVSPPLPAGESEARIWIEQAPGLRPVSFPAYFYENLTPQIEVTLMPTGDTRLAPVVSLTVSKSDVAPGEQIRIGVVTSDADEPGQGNLRVDWDYTSGNLSFAGSDRLGLWTAPALNVMAIITVKVTDSSGLVGISRLPLTVGHGGLGNVRPVAANIQLASDTKNIRMSFDLSDEESDMISVKVYYSTNGGTSFSQTSNIIGSTSNLASGNDLSLIWQPGADLSQIFDQVVIRIVPEDPGGAGATAESPVFALDASNVLPQSAPGNVFAEAGPGCNTISFAAISGATSYNLYWSLTDSPDKVSGEKISGIANPFLHNDLDPGQAYYYAITAVNDWGESAVSAPASATPMTALLPAPQNLNAQAGSSFIDVSWLAVAGADSYNLYYSTSASVSKASATKVVDAQSPYRHAGLVHGNTYYYAVTALDARGESAESTTASATVDAQPPLLVSLSPANTSYAVASGSRLVMTFNKPVVTGAGEIRIYDGSGGLRELIEVDDDSVSIAEEKVTVTPGQPFDSDTFYYITVSAGAFKDEIGNNFAGILTAQEWRFKAMFVYNEALNWNHSVINASAAWQYSTGEGAVVAVIDSGIDLLHTEFSGQLYGNGIDYVNDGSFLQDDSAHGTHVAGIIAARGNSGGVIGIAPRAKVFICKVLSGVDGVGYVSDSIQAVEDSVGSGARIINLSLGGPDYVAAYDEMITWAWNQGVLVCAAAGNDNATPIDYPARYSQSVAVGATDAQDNRTVFSNYGSDLGIAAPGEDIYSTAVGGGYQYMSGTSMATPHVAAVAALILARHPDFTPQNILDALNYGALDLGDPGKDPYFGYGRIDALRSLQYEAAASISASRQSVTATVRKSDYSASEFKTAELLVCLQPGTVFAEILREAGLADAGIREIRQFRTPGLIMVSVPAGREIEIGRKLQELSQVKYAELNAVIRRK